MQAVWRKAGSTVSLALFCSAIALASCAIEPGPGELDGVDASGAIETRDASAGPDASTELDVSSTRDSGTTADHVTAEASTADASAATAADAAGAILDASGDEADAGAAVDSAVAGVDAASVAADAGSSGDAGPSVDTGPSSNPAPSPEELALESARMALAGIVRYVGAHYQSCAPLLHLDTLPDQALREHYGQPTSHSDPAQCVDRREADFRYLTFGNIFEDIGEAGAGETSLDPDAGRLALYRGEIDSFGRVHCSGALAGTMAAANMKYFVGQTQKDYSPNTSELEELISSGEHCFVNPTMTRDFSLLPGDIINVSAGHVVRVLQIGADPLGLQQVETREDCDAIRRQDLDFTFVHSTSNEVYSGIHFQHTSDSTINLFTNLVRAVRQMCRDSLADGEIRGEIPHVDLGDREFLGGLIVREKHFRVLRHVGPRVAECVWEPAMPVRGDRCLLPSCYDEVLTASSFPPPSGAPEP